MLWILGVVLMTVCVVGGLIASYFLASSGQHGGAGEGALTVARLAVRLAESPRPAARRAHGPATVPGLFGLPDVISGYVVAEVTGRHHRADDVTSVPGWVDPAYLVKQMTGIPAVAGPAEHTTRLPRVLTSVA